MTNSGTIMKWSSIFLIALIVACTTTHDEKLHAQSVETHNLAIKIGEHVRAKIERIEAHAMTLGEPLRAMLKDSVETLSRDLAYWESTIVEVPGHEHDHHHHEGHDHDHSPSSHLTPEMILDIQRDLRDRIVKLNIRAQKLLNTLEKDKHEPVEEKEKASRYGA